MTDSFGGREPGSYLPSRKSIDINGRQEHEAILRDPIKCAELGLDHIYEVLIYLKRWGSWLKNED